MTQETFGDTIDIFQDPARKVSAHYVVRSADGHVAQCVRERDVAWHAGNWDYNTRSIGIEHEGWVDKPEYFTDVIYEESAKLTPRSAPLRHPQGPHAHHRPLRGPRQPPHRSRTVWDWAPLHPPS